MNYESIREAYLAIYEGKKKETETQEEDHPKPKETPEGSGSDEALFMDLMSQYNSLKKLKGKEIEANKIKTRADRLRFKNVSSDALKVAKDV
jgi:phenylalanyl-tRNA synthetase beta subunit